MRHYVQNLIPNFPHKPCSNPTDVLYNDPTCSKLYNLIFKMHCPPLVAIRSAWEQDLNSTFTDHTWELILKHIHSSSICARHTHLQFNVVHQIHIYRTKLARLYPNFDHPCDICKVAPGLPLHMYWSSPTLTEFWTSYFENISEILNHKVERSLYFTLV